MTGEYGGPALLRRVLQLLAPYRRHGFLLVLAALGAAAIGVANPLLTKVIFDEALFPADGGSPRLGLLGVLIGLMGVAVAIAGVIAIGQTYLMSVVGHQVMHDLRERLYTHLQRMSLRFFTGVRTGEIQARVAGDVAGVGPVVSEAMASLLANSLFVAVSLLAMALLSWQLALVSLVVLPAFVYMSYRVGRRSRDLQSERQKTAAEMSVITEETLSVSGALLTKVFDRHHDAVDRYSRESRRLAELGVRQQMAGRTTLGLIEAFMLISPGIAYLVAGVVMATSSTRLTPGTIVALAALQMRLFIPARQLMERVIQIHASLALFERIFQYLDLRHEIVDDANARHADAAAVRGKVTLRDVWFGYDDPDGRRDDGGRRRWALEDVNVTIEPGQLAAIVGPTGAGKTTLTYLIARLYEPTRGSVEIDGVDVREIKLSSLAAIVGMVTQETTLFHTSVRENLLLAKPDATPDELESAARAALIHDRILELEHGYDTIVGERGYRMSVGEKQRLAIARVVLMNPRILLLDEATSALDTRSEQLVQAALQRLMAGRTTIAIAHRLSTVAAADVILVLDRGRIVERGTHEELLARAGLYAQLYERQFQVARAEGRERRVVGGSSS